MFWERISSCKISVETIEDLKEKVSMKDFKPEKVEKELSIEDILEKIEENRVDYYKIDYRKVVKNLSNQNLGKEKEK